MHLELSKEVNAVRALTADVIRVRLAEGRRPMRHDHHMLPWLIKRLTILETSLRHIPRLKIHPGTRCLRKLFLLPNAHMLPLGLCRFRFSCSGSAAGVQSSKEAKAGDPDQETVSGRSSILSHPGNGCPAPTVTSRSPLNAQKRPSSGDGSPPNGAPSKRSQPPLDVRKDLMAHFPVKTKRGRCRHCSKGYTNTQCTKCDVRLCFSDDRNCFWDYHCILI
ncbi:hypothetical protein F7725_024771 [Dissostichus mawsoni]|uniref:Uncharacterized protein n=1 Tax=Dissostichus mawsoni TaxID=36200 RepID=A0A7J5XAC4_DISMA|nr:hypothetical protein F7725_024771 [Dissostichus mawsoni]